MKTLPAYLSNGIDKGGSANRCETGKGGWLTLRHDKRRKSKSTNRGAAEAAISAKQKNSAYIGAKHETGRCRDEAKINNKRENQRHRTSGAQARLSISYQQRMKSNII